MYTKALGNLRWPLANIAWARGYYQYERMPMRISDNVANLNIHFRSDPSDANPTARRTQTYDRAHFLARRKRYLFSTARYGCFNHSTIGCNHSANGCSISKVGIVVVAWRLASSDRSLWARIRSLSAWGNLWRGKLWRASVPRRVFKPSRS